MTLVFSGFFNLHTAHARNSANVIFLASDAMVNTNLNIKYNLYAVLNGDKAIQLNPDEDNVIGFDTSDDLSRIAYVSTIDNRLMLIVSLLPRGDPKQFPLTELRSVSQVKLVPDIVWLAGIDTHDQQIVTGIDLRDGKQYRLAIPDIPD